MLNMLYKISEFAILSILFTSSSAQRNDGQFWPCNPVTNATGACMPNPGLPNSTYYIDFTTQATLPPDWTISNYASVPFGPSGAEFTFAKRYDSPQLFTNFYIFFGRVETVMKVAPGQGIVSSAVLMSDDADEIDWEFSGNNFNLSTAGLGQNNYFGKGVTGNYDRGQFFNMASPQTQFHTYTTDWSPTQITWSVDGVVIRTLTAAECAAKGSNYQYPQTPSKFQLGMWDGGDADANWGTVSWAGGYTDVSKAPYTMYVKSVSITNANPAWAYNWTDQSGSWQSIQLLQKPVVPSPSSSTSKAWSTIAISASSSVISQISSSLSSLDEQFAGTAGVPSATASIGTAMMSSQVSSLKAVFGPTSTQSSTFVSISKTISSTASVVIPITPKASSSTACISTSQPVSSRAGTTSTSTSKTTGSASSTLSFSAGVKTSTSVSSVKKAAYTPYWHYWRNNGHWVRGWW